MDCQHEYDEREASVYVDGLCPICMLDELKKLREKVRKEHPPIVRGREVWAQKEPPKKMVWAVCPYTRGNSDGCEHCPTWFTDPTHGKMQRGCYGLAAEACRVVFSMKNRKRQ